MENAVQERARLELRLRIGAEMAAYLRRRADDASDGAPVAVIGGDARTGLPVRMELERQTLKKVADPT